MQRARRGGNGRDSAATHLGRPGSDWYNALVVFNVLWDRVEGLTGSLVDAEAEAEEFYRRIPARKPAARALAAGLLGRVMLSRGQVQSAGHFLREAALRARAGRSGPLLHWCLSGVARTAALAGDLAAAERALGEAEDLASSAPPRRALDLALARGWVVAAQGEVGRAATLVMAAADAAAEAADDGDGGALAALALHDAVRLGAGLAVSDRLRDAAAREGSELLDTCAAHAVALQGADARGLAGAAARFEWLGADLLAAEAWTEAGAVHRAGECRSEAATAAGRARACLDRCQGARTPALIPEVILAPFLTPRQREVARLVALGLSNREVAGKLYVSLRTVENHLYQVYVKLDVPDRKALALRLCAPLSA